MKLLYTSIATLCVLGCATPKKISRKHGEQPQATAMGLRAKAAWESLGLPRPAFVRVQTSQGHRDYDLSDPRIAPLSFNGGPQEEWFFADNTRIANPMGNPAAVENFKRVLEGY